MSRSTDLCLATFGLRPLALAALLLSGCATTDPAERPVPAAESPPTETAMAATPATKPGEKPATKRRPPAASPPALEPFTEKIAGTALSFDMVPVPAGQDESGRAIAPFWIAKTETTWDVYDVFVFRLDTASPGTGSGAGSGAGSSADGVTRPSKPYIAMDRGFGHNGMPALSMSFRGAEALCEWLSRKTGRTYRLPTEAEWKHACRAGGIAPALAADYAWFAANADYRTHPVGSKHADRLGVHDLLGNASEWCVGAGGEPVTLGGSYRDPLMSLGPAGRVLPIPDWNASDPQFPKSVWWLADAGFVGLRVVCVPGE